MARVLLTATEAAASASASASASSTPSASDREQPQDAPATATTTSATNAGAAAAAAVDAALGDFSSSLLTSTSSPRSSSSVRIRDVMSRLDAVALVHRSSGLPPGPSFLKVLLDAMSEGNSEEDHWALYHSRQALEACVAALEAAFDVARSSQGNINGTRGATPNIPALLEGLYEEVLLSSSDSISSTSKTSETRNQQAPRRRRGILRDAIWPLALPPCRPVVAAHRSSRHDSGDVRQGYDNDDDENHRDPVVLSVSCGNTSYTWALHENRGSKEDGDSSDGWAVTTTWKTAALTSELCRERNDDPCGMLEAFLPPPILELFFGPFIFAAPHAVPNDTNIDGNSESPPSPSAPDLDDPNYRHSRMTSQRMWQTALTHRRRHPVMYVYVISTNPIHELGVEYLLQDAPVSVWRLANTDFFSKEMGCYPSLGVDRAAAALAAVSITGLPALVVDGGTAMTYTAVDPHGKLLGGGITPGINLKLQSLARGTGALPYLQVPTVLERIQNCQQTKVPIPFASNNTPDAILSGVLRETTAFLCSVVEAWRTMCALKDEHRANRDDGAKAAAAAVGDDNPADDPTAMEVDDAGVPNDDGHGTGDTESSGTNKQFSVNHKMRFLVTGGDAPLIRALLSPKHSYIVETLPQFPSRGYSGSIALTQHEHLVHYGIAHVLHRQQRSLVGGTTIRSTADSAVSPTVGFDDALEQTRMKLMGLRVLRRSSPRDTRGTVVSALRRGSTLDRDLFCVLYDSQATELLSVVELHDSLMDYYVEGEECLTRPQAKQDASLRGAQLLLDRCPHLSAHLALLGRSGPRPRNMVGPARLTMTDVFPAVARQEGGAEGHDSKLAAGRSPSASQRAMAPNAFRIPTSKSLCMNPRLVVGRRCCKRFEGDPSQLYFGTIMSHCSAGGDDRDAAATTEDPEENGDDVEDDDDDDDVWRVEYDDGDLEDWDVESVLHGLELYARKHLQDPQVASSSPPSSSDGAQGEDSPMGT